MIRHVTPKRVRRLLLTLALSLAAACASSPPRPVAPIGVAFWNMAPEAGSSSCATLTARLTEARRYAESLKVEVVAFAGAPDRAELEKIFVPGRWRLEVATTTGGCAGEPGSGFAVRTALTYARDRQADGAGITVRRRGGSALRLLVLRSAPECAGVKRLTDCPALVSGFDAVARWRKGGGPSVAIAALPLSLADEQSAWGPIFKSVGAVNIAGPGEHPACRHSATLQVFMHDETALHAARYDLGLPQFRPGSPTGDCAMVMVYRASRVRL